MTRTADRLVEEYMTRLNRELRDLPRARRRELVEEIEEHIAEARAALDAESEAAIRTLLERLGDPADIAADARERFGVERPRGGGLEVAAIVLLLVGGFLAFVGWLAGLALLWASNVWTTREKLVGTLVVPGGLATLAVVLLYGGTVSLQTASGECAESFDPATGEVVLRCVEESGGSWLVAALGVLLFLFLLVGPIFTTIFLARRMRRSATGAREASPRVV